MFPIYIWRLNIVLYNKQYMQVTDSLFFIFACRIDGDDDGDNNDCNYISMF